MYPRPSTLHGLKHKLHTATAAKTLHANSQNSGPNRRKSVGHIPLSPLARTPSPSPLPASSPTRSPSPLLKAANFPVCHLTGSSNQTQAYVPGTSPGANNIPTGAVAKKTFARPKSAEPSSPLLRRALSPDRLHPRTAENKIVVSPLCCNVPIKTNQRPAGGIWRSGSATVIGTSNGAGGGQYTTSTTISERITEHEDENEEDDDDDEPNPPPPSPQVSNMSQGLSLALQAPGEMLPRIAEEKDSPTSCHDEPITKPPTQNTVTADKPSVKRASSIERRKSPDKLGSRSTSNERKLSLVGRKLSDEKVESDEKVKSEVKVSVKEQIQKLDKKANQQGGASKMDKKSTSGSGKGRQPSPPSGNPPN